MLYIFRLLLLLINIDQETVLNWFGMEDPSNQELRQAIESGSDLTFSTMESSTNISLETFRLLTEGLWEKVQDGLTLADIENVLFFILFIRFVIIAIRYNLKTSFYITCIGLFAGYLWYRHLIDLISMYRSVLLKLPFLHKLGMDAVQLRSLNRQMALTDLKLGENAHWYNPGQVIYYAFTKGIVNIDPETGLRYYIDPISMFLSNLQEPNKSNIVPFYYNVYNKVIPKIYGICSKFWNQLSGVAAYAVITRIGKRYCPYLVRWHWTFLLIIGMVEQIFIYFIYRVSYFQSFVLIPKAEIIPATDFYQGYIDPNIALQVNILNGIIACVVLSHIGLIIFGLFHAIWGQYFYIPFFVENTELHIGPRPKNSIYSGGYTSWQDSKEKEKNLNRLLPKLWYGWFGKGTSSQFQFVPFFKKLFKKVFQKILKQLRK
jgi:Uncharacterised protein family|uniref:Uncharacterized protein n=1 Tax=Didymosphenia geminata TaxID=1115533 RepID=A0A023HAM3_9STRA|nr:hypothetical protein [Didymosphenia geminata]AGH28701.1 hypothetical protein [Didymosphenia geminata]